MTAVVHIIGRGIRIGPVARQLCAFCGEKILDDDARLTAYSDGGGPMFWPEGQLLEVDAERGFRTVIAQTHGDQLPEHCCAVEPKRPALTLVKKPDPVRIETLTTEIVYGEPEPEGKA